MGGDGTGDRLGRGPADADDERDRSAWSIGNGEGGPAEQALRRAASALADGAKPESIKDHGLDSRVAKNLARLEALRDDFREGARDRGVPETWGHLEVRSLLGEGGFGAVFRAFDPVLQREVALKLRHRAGRETAAEAIGEARRLARVRHPNVLAVHGADVHDGRVGMWMDLIEGETLEDRLSATGSEPASGSVVPRVLTSFAEVMRGLAAVHDAGLIHGDVKAANVLIEPDGTHVLSDFGAGRVAELGGRARTGSPRTSAPEVLRGEVNSPASDIWSAGGLLYRWLSGRYPFGDEAPHNAAADPVLRWPSGVPRSLISLTQRTLAAEPADRPSADQVLEDLERIERAPARRRRRTAVGVVLASLLMGLVLASLGLVRSQRGEVLALEALESERAVRSFVLSLMESADPNHLGGQTIALEQLLEIGAARVEEELAGQPRAQQDLYLSLARIERLQSRLDRAEDLLDRAEEISSLVAEDRDRNAANLLAERGLIAYARGRYDLAVDRLGQAVERRRSGGQGTSVGLVRNLVDLSIAVRAGGDYAVAESLARQALEEMPPVEGKETGEVLADATYHLGVAVYLQRRYEEAETLVRSALAMFEEALGQNHLKVAQALNRLGLIAKREERFDEALTRYERALDVTETILGPVHPEVAMLVGNIGALHRHAGTLVDAESSLRRALAIQRVALGDAHPDLAINLNNLALVLEDSGRPEEAVTVFREVADIWRRVHGDRHPYMALAQTHLARLSRAQGRDEEALGHAMVALRITCSLSDEQPARVSQRRNLVGDLLDALGRSEDADRYRPPGGDCPDSLD